MQTTPASSLRLQDVIEELSRGVDRDEIAGLLEAAAARIGVEPSATAAPLVIQEFRPLFSSLESELAQVYWQQVGVQAFAGNEVPFIINNDGRLSQAAAEVAFENCLENDHQGPIHFLELGAGSGLFARFFLDSFRELCRRHSTDFYERLTYFVTDMSRRTVEQWQELGQFDEHRMHVVLAMADAVQCEKLCKLDGSEYALRDLTGVFTNYVLDVLPATVIRAQAGVAEQLCVRTHLADEGELQRLFPDWTVETLRAAAQADSEEQRTALLSVLNLLGFDTAFVPVEHHSPPYLEEALSFGPELPRVLLNFGALGCLENLLSRITSAGFVLVNDYGPAKESEVANFGTTTRFGRSIAMGINFPLLEYVFERRGLYVRKGSGDDERSIHSRLLRQQLPKTFSRFEDLFSLAAVNALESAIGEARRRVTAGACAMRSATSATPLNASLTTGAFWARWRNSWSASEFRVPSSLPSWPCAVIPGIALVVEYSGRRVLSGRSAGSGAHGVRQGPLCQSDRCRDQLQPFIYLCCDVPVSGRSGCAATALANDFQGAFRERILHQQQRIMFEISNRSSSDTLRIVQRAALSTSPLVSRRPARTSNGPAESCARHGTRGRRRSSRAPVDP